MAFVYDNDVVSLADIEVRQGLDCTEVRHITVAYKDCELAVVVPFEFAIVA